MFDTTRLSSRGQIIIPQRLRDKMKLKPGTIFTVEIQGDTLVFKVLKKA